MSDHNNKLHGCWRLVTFETELQDSKQRAQPWGADPNGYLVFHPDGRMMYFGTAKGREPWNSDEKLAALFRTLLGFTGRYRIEGDRFITKVDASWNEAWNGTEQERFYKVDGDRLEVSTAWMPNPLAPGNPIGRGILSFRRE